MRIQQIKKLLYFILGPKLYKKTFKIPNKFKTVQHRAESEINNVKRRKHRLDYNPNMKEPPPF